MSDEPVTLATEPPIPGAKADDPAISYKERRDAAIEEAEKEMIPAPIPTATPLEPMTDEDALAMAREIEARYMPPPLPPSITTLINRMKEGAPPEQPSYPPAAEPTP